MAGTNNPIDQVKQFWASRSKNQRLFLLGGGAATVLMLALFTHLISTPDYKPLFTGLESDDAQTLSAQLDSQGIPHQTSADGKTISVPADKLDAARMQTASQGEPHSGRMGFELFDKMSWGQTEFDEKVTYQRALEGELERSIATLSDVQSARVHLVMPTDSVFMDRERGAKASVVLKLRRGDLSKGTALAISRLVAGAVDELKPEDVSIVDADTDRALGIGRDGSDTDGGDGSVLSERLVSTLSPVVGAEKIRASVNVDYDQGTTEESQEKYDPAVSAVLSTQKSEDQAGGSSVPSGVPGTSSNISTDKTKPAAAAPVSLQSSKTESEQYGVNKTVVHTVTPAGRVARITAAILVDDATVKTVTKGKTTFTHRKRTQEELDKIRQLAEAAIGFDAKRGDIISVQNLSFDGDSADSDLPAPTWATQVQKTVSDYSSLMRPLSLLGLFVLAYLFVVRPVQKHALRPGTAVPGPEPALPAPDTEELPTGVSRELSAGAARASQLKVQTADLIRQKPQQTARALQAWLREEPS
jgi:flagellar M-ring protein FliF